MVRTMSNRKTATRLSSNHQNEQQEIVHYLHEQDVLLSGGGGNEKDLGIEVEENHIYFYTDVTEKTALELIRLLRRLDVEMSYLADRLELDEAPPIILHINSPGGYINAATAICDAINSCKNKVYTYVEGHAASAGSLISTQGTRRFIRPSARMLMHQQRLGYEGKFDDFLDEADNQKQVFDIITRLYLPKIKLNKKQLKDLLKKEKYLTAEECVEHGFADEIR